RIFEGHTGPDIISMDIQTDTDRFSVTNSHGQKLLSNKKNAGVEVDPSIELVEKKPTAYTKCSEYS
ncbi:hypothetical protein, partial [Faecalibaculum rodentium]